MITINGYISHNSVHANRISTAAEEKYEIGHGISIIYLSYKLNKGPLKRNPKEDPILH